MKLVILTTDGQTIPVFDELDSLDEEDLADDVAALTIGRAVAAAVVAERRFRATRDRRERDRITSGLHGSKK